MVPANGLRPTPLNSVFCGRFAIRRTSVPPVIAALLGLSTVAFSGGKVELPSSCTGPAHASVDFEGGFLATITCDAGKTRVVLIGSPTMPSSCSRERAQFVSRNGAPISVCLLGRPPRSAKDEPQSMLADLGGGACLEVTVRRPQDALLLLQIASSFKRVPE